MPSFFIYLLSTHGLFSLLSTMFSVTLFLASNPLTSALSIQYATTPSCHTNLLE